MRIFENMDCMEGMKEYPDKFFDLAIVDPPYGGGQTQVSGADSQNMWLNKKRSRFGGHFDKYKIEPITRTAGTWSEKYQENNNIKHWDIAPDESYFEELFRVSKNQIIFGGNYFPLPPSRNFIIWRKLTISDKFSMAMAEYAWTNISGNAKVFECVPQDKNRFHPTQKPVALYKWLSGLYIKPGYKILDTHVGSASSLIAYEELNIDYVGYEINKHYYDNAVKRLDEFKKQGRFL